MTCVDLQRRKLHARTVHLFPAHTFSRICLKSAQIRLGLGKASYSQAALGSASDRWVGHLASLPDHKQRQLDTPHRLD